MKTRRRRRRERRERTRVEPRPTARAPTALGIPHATFHVQQRQSFNGGVTSSFDISPSVARSFAFRENGARLRVRDERTHSSNELLRTNFFERTSSNELDDVRARASLVESNETHGDAARDADDGRRRRFPLQMDVDIDVDVDDVMTRA